MTEPTSPRDDRKTLEQVLPFLCAKDDTSRFVGLSLLRTILDSYETLRNDESIIKQCWAAVPNKFVIRLLRPASEDQDNDETKNMNNLAVAVIHTFVNLLPNDLVSADKKFLELISPLVKALNALDAATKMLAFQTLQVLVSSPSGAHVFARVEQGLAISTTADQEASLREWLRLYDIAINAAHDTELQDFLSKFLVGQLQAYESKGILLQVLGSMASQIRILWLSGMVRQIIDLIHSTITKRPTPQARVSSTVLASSIVQNFAPGSWPLEFLFSDPPGVRAEDKPFAYVFTQYILIDLRSTIPTLMPALASPTYLTTALRLAACYDVITSFITYLISLMFSKSPTGNSMPPDLLLKLRRDISETFSLTLEFFRDRWDAVTSGASGLEPSARLDPKAPPMLTWDNPTVPPEEDPILLSGLRAFSLWLREDDNEELRTQALGVMDMLGALYEGSTNVGATADFRPPIRSLFEALLKESTQAVNTVLTNSGWDLLAKDLESNIILQDWCAVRDIIRVLLAIVDSEAVLQSREKWMHILKLAASLNDKDASMEQLEALAEVFHLAIGIYEKAPSRLQKLAHDDERRIRDAARGMTRTLRQRSDVEEGLVDSFAEIGLMEV